MQNEKFTQQQFAELLSQYPNRPILGPIVSVFGNPIVQRDDGTIVLFERCEYCGQTEIEKGRFCAKCGAPI